VGKKPSTCLPKAPVGSIEARFLILDVSAQLRSLARTMQFISAVPTHGCGSTLSSIALLLTEPVKCFC
jgi:hypothetical protein